MSPSPAFMQISSDNHDKMLAQAQWINDFNRLSTELFYGSLSTLKLCKCQSGQQQYIIWEFLTVVI